jgi:hypothetical protein
MDILITGDMEKSKERMQDREKFSNSVAEFVHRPVPSLKDIMGFLPKDAGRTSPIDSSVANPNQSDFLTAFKNKFENADNSNSEFVALLQRFNKANKTNFTTYKQVATATSQQIQNYLKFDSLAGKSRLPKTNDERNTAIQQGIHKKTATLLAKVPQDSPIAKAELEEYTQKVEKHLSNLLDLNATEIKIPARNDDNIRRSNTYTTLKVKKTMGESAINTFQQALLAKKHKNSQKKEPVDLDIPFEMNFEVEIDAEQQAFLDGPEGSQHFLAKQFFPVKTKNGEKKISEHYTVRVKHTDSVKEGHLVEDIDGLSLANLSTEIKEKIDAEKGRISPEKFQKIEKQIENIDNQLENLTQQQTNDAISTETYAQQKQALETEKHTLEKELEANNRYDKLTYLVNDKGEVEDVYTEKDLRDSEIEIINNKINLQGEDLQDFIAQVLMPQVALGTDPYGEERIDKIEKALTPPE